MKKSVLQFENTPKNWDRVGSHNIFLASNEQKTIENFLVFSKIEYFGNDYQIELQEKDILYVILCFPNLIFEKLDLSESNLSWLSKNFESYYLVK